MALFSEIQFQISNIANSCKRINKKNRLNSELQHFIKSHSISLRLNQFCDKKILNANPNQSQCLAYSNVGSTCAQCVRNVSSHIRILTICTWFYFSHNYQITQTYLHFANMRRFLHAQCTCTLYTPHSAFCHLYNCKPTLHILLASRMQFIVS